METHVYEQVLLDSIVEYFVFHKLHNEGYLKTTKIFCSPDYYFRYNKQKYLFIDTEKGKLVVENTTQLSQEQIKNLHSVIHAIHFETFNFYQFIISREPGYSFLFSAIKGNQYCEPRDINEKQLSLLHYLLRKNKKNFFGVLAITHFLYQKNTCSTHIASLFEILLEIDPGNPYILAHYGRVLGSSMFKGTGNIKYALKSVQMLELSLKNIGNFEGSVIHAWLGQAQMACNLYKEAIYSFDTANSINIKNNFFQPEPIIWKAKALLYMNQADTCISILEDIKVKIDEYDGDNTGRVKGLLDFRFYKILATAYIEKGYFDKAQNSIILSILHYGKNMFIEINKKTYNIYEDTSLIIDSFLVDFKNIINSHSKEQQIFFILGILKKVFSDKKVFFSNTKQLEDLCYKVMQHKYGL